VSKGEISAPVLVIVTLIILLILTAVMIYGGIYERIKKPIAGTGDLPCTYQSGNCNTACAADEKPLVGISCPSVAEQARVCCVKKTCKERGGSCLLKEQCPVDKNSQVELATCAEATPPRICCVPKS
jgi:hypothetical protein